MDRERDMGFVNVLGMPTSVLKYGKISPDTKAMFIVIPGNPGVVEYYDHFMSHLFTSSHGTIPVWGVSHAGHVLPPAGNQALYRKLSYEVCTLHGQIRHKVAFIKENIPSNVRLFLIGHSIGCYIILKILDQLEQPIGRCFMLFPTIERMAVSPNGRVYTPVLKYLRWLAPFFVSGASLLPQITKKWLIRRHFQDENVPQCVHSATEGLLNPFCVSNSLFMAHQEMAEVAELDKTLVASHLDYLSFYFGQSDDWCPPHYGEDFKKLFPTCDVRVCENGYSHAYVIDASLDMANIVSKWCQDFM
ncbi:lipid droplet-associated hydrolase-like [Mercenaria mercenaria]|uniref:lipid droplet-associated hydrolase-like n=1 Tax=Mercenaria mercenaria TaxID=6596 RepID=UPI00234F8603|nr:lipid droplet-associated hydrolase-like [Mercenaria mercenaria]XP_045180981.2 lipid droplet-associated hydrolase-like [Mercenaria mercenaria]